jgi:HEPN domain-containing protein
MRPDNTTRQVAEQWLRLARSDLALAHLDAPGAIMPETLCFHAQQAAEKALRAALVLREIDFPRTHSLGVLLALMPTDVKVPVSIRDAASLTNYAVAARYPSVFEPVTDDERRDAADLATRVVNWAAAMITTEA